MDLDAESDRAAAAISALAEAAESTGIQVQTVGGLADPDDPDSDDDQVIIIPLCIINELQSVYLNS